jgi:MYXO-CTERM domain-containing protein
LDSLIPVNDASSFPAKGTVQIDGERIFYLNKIHNSLTGAQRGVGGTTAMAHALGAAVVLLSSPATPIPNATPTTVVHVVEIDSPYKAIGQGGGCSLVGTRGHLGNGWLTAAGLAYVVLRRRRKK